MTLAETLVDRYFTWLRSKTQLKDIDGVLEITTPFLDRHNDRIQIYVRPVENDQFQLTDDGATLSDLELSGCKLDTPHRKQLLSVILNGLGVVEVDGELTTLASVETFGHRKHNLLQAILAVNDMFMTATHRVARLFLEDVTHFLDEHNVRYTPTVIFPGRSGFPHRFDFVIPRSRSKPERIIKAINHPNKESAQSFLFAWTDTKETRPPKVAAYAILNDTERPINSDVIGAFHQYDVNTIRWSQREQYASDLAA